jgi:Ca-activated chloride channel family protein
VNVQDLIAMLHDVTFARPDALYLLAIPIIVLLWSLIGLRSFGRIFAPLMRALALALFVLALAGPEKVMRIEGATRPAVLDVSASITPAMRAWETDLIGKQLKLRPSDPAILFGSENHATTVSDAIETLKSAGGCRQCAPNATNLENALRALAANPTAKGGPAVIVTDGWQNRGDATRAIASLLAADIRLFMFTPPGAASVPNVAMTELALPSALSKSAPFALGVTMENLNNTPVAGTIEIYRNGTLLDQRKVTLKTGQERFDFPVQTENAGLDSYKASFKADNPALDAYLEDDSLQGWVGVGARRKILVLTDNQKDAGYLDTVIHRMGLDAVIVPVADGEWNGSLAGYDAVILNNLPRERLSEAAQNALVSYVDRGGSLVMTGGDESFGLGGYQNTPIAKIMPVVMKPPEHKERQRALILVIDKSGSMGRSDKLKFAVAAAEKILATLKDNDLIAVIGFDSQPFVVVPLQTVATSRPYFNQLVERLKAQGRTYLMPAIEQAERTLVDTDAPVKHVIVLSDGKVGGTLDMYYSLIASMHHDLGATVSTIAIGADADFSVMEGISKFGGGGYFQTDNAKNLPEIFVEDFKQHGGDVTMVEIQFTPHTVSPNAVLKDYAGRPLPPLLGYVTTELKPRASLDAYVDRQGRRDPVIASWRYNAGKTLAVTTDASGRWSGPWIARNTFTPVWNRILTWMTPETAAEQKIDVALGYQAGRLRVKLTDYSDSAGFGSHLVTAMVTHPDGSHTQTALGEEAPGELAGAIDAATPGTYYIEVKSTDSKATPLPPLAYTVSGAVTAELPRPEPNYAILEQLASATGGRLNPSYSDVEITRPTVERRQSLDAYLVVVAMILLIGEALLRRLTV